jgi:hypothetical protein
VLKKQNAPKSVRMVAAVCLLFVVFNLYFFFFRLSTAPIIASLSLMKAIVGIAMTLGLRRLSEGWRVLMVFVTGLGVLMLPFYFAALSLSSELLKFASEHSGVQSRIAMQLFLVVAFALSLFMFLTIRRPDVKEAFLPDRETHQD